MDVKSTFLHDELKEGIHMVQIESYKEHDRRYFICKHQKAIYELRQTFQMHNERINDFLKQKGFEQCKFDTSIYVLMEQEQVFYLVLNVDDLLVFSKCVDAIKRIKTTLSKEFDLMDLGKFTFY